MRVDISSKCMYIWMWCIHQLSIYYIVYLHTCFFCIYMYVYWSNVPQSLSCNPSKLQQSLLWNSRSTQVAFAVALAPHKVLRSHHCPGGIRWTSSEAPVSPGFHVTLPALVKGISSWHPRLNPYSRTNSDYQSLTSCVSMDLAQFVWELAQKLIPKLQRVPGMIKHVSSAK